MRFREKLNRLHKEYFPNKWINCKCYFPVKKKFFNPSKKETILVKKEGTMFSCLINKEFKYADPDLNKVLGFAEKLKNNKKR